jgi:hypothetical protein
MTMGQLGGGVVFLVLIFVAWRCYKIRKARRMAREHSPDLAAQQSVLADAGRAGLPYASKASPTGHESDQLQPGLVAQQSVLADAECAGLPYASKASPTGHESDQLQRGAVPLNP